MIEGNKLNDYLKNLAEYNEIKDICDTAFMDGERKKAIEIATRMLTKGLDVATISEMTLLGMREIETLREEREATESTHHDN